MYMVEAVLVSVVYKMHMAQVWHAVTWHSDSGRENGLNSL